ncbi:unnamed protein product, partial [Polarella glacialis]
MATTLALAWAFGAPGFVPLLDRASSSQSRRTASALLEGQLRPRRRRELNPEALCSRWPALPRHAEPRVNGGFAEQAKDSKLLPERVFLVPFPRIPPDPLPALNMDNLSAWERFDTLCRCVVAALMTSRRIRRNTRFLAVFTKPPWIGAKVAEALRESLQGRRLPEAPPHTQLEVRGEEVQMMYAEERWVAATFEKALKRFSDPELGAAWAKSARTAGWRLSSPESLAAVLE